MSADGISWTEAVGLPEVWDQPEAGYLSKWARIYAEMGWATWPCYQVLPDGACACSNKHCKAKGKHGHYGWSSARRTSPDVNVKMADAWWGTGQQENIAIVPNRSDLVVVDIDSREAWDALHRVYEVPPTLTEVSGRGEGWHLYYRHPSVADERLRGFVYAEGVGVEIKHNALVVVTPSLGGSGRQYVWANWGAEIADAPSWAVQERAPADVWVAGRHFSEEEADALRAYASMSRAAMADNPWASMLLDTDLAGLESLRRLTEGFNRPTVAFAVAVRIGKWATESGPLGVEDSVAMILDACRENGSVDKYGEREMDRQIRNGIEMGRRTVEAALREGDADGGSAPVGDRDG